jgi:uncharacterized membrane protein
MFSLIALGNGVGLALGPVITTALWQWRGTSAVTTFASISLMLAAILLWLFLRDRKEE